MSIFSVQALIKGAEPLRFEGSMYYAEKDWTPRTPRYKASSQANQMRVTRFPISFINTVTLNQHNLLNHVPEWQFSYYFGEARLHANGFGWNKVSVILNVDEKHCEICCCFRYSDSSYRLAELHPMNWSPWQTNSCKYDRDTPAYTHCAAQVSVLSELHLWNLLGCCVWEAHINYGSNPVYRRRVRQFIGIFHFFNLLL